MCPCCHGNENLEILTETLSFWKIGVLSWHSGTRKSAFKKIWKFQPPSYYHCKLTRRRKTTKHYSFTQLDCQIFILWYIKNGSKRSEHVSPHQQLPVWNNTKAKISVLWFIYSVGEGKQIWENVILAMSTSRFFWSHFLSQSVEVLS